MLSLQKKGAVQTKDGVEFAVIDGIVGAQGPVNTPSCRRRFSLHLHTDGAVVQMNKAFAKTPGGAASYVVPPEGEHTTDTLIQLSERPEELPVALNARFLPRSSAV